LTAGVGVATAFNAPKHKNKPLAYSIWVRPIDIPYLSLRSGEWG